MVTFNGTRVTFRVECPHAVKVFLVGDFAQGLAEVFGMDQVSPNVWQTDMDLPPGEYRFCYYLYDGRTVRYQPPDPPRNGEVDGLKAVLRVEAAEAGAAA